MLSLRHALLLLGLLLCSLCTVAHASQDKMLDDASVNIGLFSSNIDASASAQSAASAGTAIDLHRDLGMPSSKSLRYLEVDWRPWRRHEFTFNYYHEGQSQTHDITRDISFQGNLFSAGAQLQARFSLDAYGAGYRYWAWIGDRAAFGLGAGLQAYSIELQLGGTATLHGSGSSNSKTALIHARASTDIPDPYLGLSYRYQLTDALRFTANGGAFKANISNINATLYNASTALEYTPFKHVGVIVQYSYNKIEADLSKARFDGKFNATFDGLQVLLKLRF